MLPNNVLDHSVEGNVTGETIGMTIDEDATAHIISVLTNLYSDQLGAMAREYITNAWDGHLMAGHTQPIHVTTPGPLSPYFTVKDSGIGLDLEGLRDIYSKYGKSTKRESNAFNGMLGLGCKSALTYTSQFSITSVKDGVKYIVSVSKDEHGVGELTVVESIKTQEPNGVEVSIPISRNDHASLRQRVRDLSRWWEDGTLIIDGEPNQRIHGERVNDRIDVFPIDTVSTDSVVMGGVLYPFPYTDERIFPAQNSWRGPDHSVVYYADMGEVTFAPSRESLITNSNTRQTFEKVRDEFNKHFAATLLESVEKCEAHFDAFLLRSQLQQKYPGFVTDGTVVPYKGEDVPYSIKCPQHTVPGKDRAGKDIDVVRDLPFHFYAAGRGSMNSHKVISADTLIRGYSVLAADRKREWKRITVIQNAPLNVDTPANRKRLRDLDEVDDLGDDWTHQFLLTTDTFDTKWIDVTIKEWSEVLELTKAVRKARVKVASEHFEVVQPIGFVQQPVDANAKVVYVSPTSFRSNGYGHLGDRFRRARAIELATAAGYTFIALAANRWDKFTREHKNAVEFNVFLANQKKEYLDSLTDTQKHILGANSDTLKFFGKVISEGLDLDDPTLVDFLEKVRAVGDVGALSKAHRTKVDTLEALHVRVGVPEFNPFEGLHYPLITNGYGEGIDRNAADNAAHTVAYINAVYNQKKGS